jgi:two-component system LytT family sensor kinase
MQRRWIKVSAIVAGWAFVGLILSLELIFTAQVHSRTMDMAYVDAWELAIPQFGRALMWALMAPLILKLREKVPLNRGRWVGGIAFHLGFSFLVMAVYYVGRIASMCLLWEWPHGAFWETVMQNFYGRNIIDMAYYWGVLAFGYSFEIYQRYKTEELKAAQLEARLVETELKALRQQLHPHFLFNTLNTVAVLVREQKHEEAVNLLARLGALLRMTLDPVRTPVVTLQQEMDFLERYIEIQQMRFSDRLRVNIDLSEEARRALIPNLLLQPIVENAILHGVAPKAGPGHVDISGRVEAGTLHLQVCDDGAGLPHAASGRQGIGLSNTRERLAKLYGAHSQFSLKSEPGRGVTVQIVMPYRV